MPLVRHVFFYAADALVKTFNPLRESESRLLLVRLDAIGDFVLWLDSAKEFRSLYPNKRITLCVNSVVYDLAVTLPHWDDVVAVHVERFSRNLNYRFRLLLQLRRRGFDTVIQPTFSRVFLHGDAIIRTTGARHRVGSMGDLTNSHSFLKRISDAWYTRLVDTAPGQMMELERNAEFIRNLSGRVFSAGLPVLPKLVDLPEGLKVRSPYFIIFPGASWTGRQWSVAKFAQVASTLYETKGWIPVLSGGPSERLVCQSVIDQSGVSCAVNLGGMTNLTELTELMRSASLLISNETSAVHVAIAVSTPTVCVLGGGHYGRFMPYPPGISDGTSVIAIHQMPCFNCNWHCTEPHSADGPVPCISKVTVKSVLGRVEVLLSRVENPSAKFSEAGAK